MTSYIQYKVQFKYNIQYKFRPDPVNCCDTTANNRLTAPAVTYYVGVI